MKLVYLIGTYPGLTTTFIDREIRIMRQWGVDLQIVAIYGPPEGMALSQEQQDLRRGTIYLMPAAILGMIWAHIYFSVLRPRIYGGTVAYLVTRSHASHRARIKTMLHFALGVYAAYLLRGREFHELHAHFVDRTATLALVAARLLGKSYSLSIHAGADVFVEPTLLREKIGEARHAVTCTSYNRIYIESMLGQALGTKITHVRHGLDLSRYRAAGYGTEHYGPLNGDAKSRPLILSVGQLAERKGFAQLIECCARLREEGYEFRCEIVGDGPQRQKLEEMIARLSLQDTVSLCGALRHEEVIEKCKQATIFALLCVVTREGDMDGIPNVIAEAMAMRLPVVSTAVSAIPELVTDGVNGLVVPPGDTDAAVAAIARLLDEPTLRYELAKNGLETISATFDVEQNVRRFATMLWPEWFAEASGVAVPMAIRGN